ncbi:MAG: cytochrome c [Rhodobiaceae bacterium]|nr:cytochrome c [Rhodobiaceae bacterium]MCC0054040.1 cytochrome c [Rhodobiaceae bacterium]
MRLFTIFALGLAVISTAALAHQGATGVVKQRMEAMKDTASQMKTIAGMVKGESALDAEVVASSATIISRHAEEIPGLFPEGSIRKPSEALPEIWTNWDDFTSRAQRLAGRARNLAEIAGSNAEAGALAATFAAMGETCKNCHTRYRVKKQ